MRIEIYDQHRRPIGFINCEASPNKDAIIYFRNTPYIIVQVLLAENRVAVLVQAAEANMAQDVHDISDLPEEIQ